MASFATTRGGYSPIFGGVPQLRNPGQVQGDVTGVLNSAIPGFSDLSASASKLIENLINGQLSPGTVNDIQDAGAAQAAASGIPGSSRELGSVFADQVLRNVGTASEQRKAQGLQGLLSLLAGYSGTAALTPAQIAEQDNSQSVYDSSPIPSYAIPYMMSQYQNAANNGSPASGRTTTPPVNTPWMTSDGRKFSNVPLGAFIRPTFG